MEIANIFPPVGCLFISLLGLFAAQIFHFDEVQVNLSVFCLSYLWCLTWEGFAWLRFAPVLSSKSIIVSAFLFRSVVHFNFYVWWKEGSSFIFLQVDIQLFLQWIVWASLGKVSCGPSFCSRWSARVSMLGPHCLDALTAVFGNLKVWALQVCTFQDCLGYSGPCAFPR